MDILARLILVCLVTLSPVVRANCGPFGYASMEAAAAAAGQRYFRQSAREDREYMGGIIAQQGRFHYTVVAGRAGADRVRVSIRIPADGALVAFWHTHGARHFSRRYFSATDTRLVRLRGLPFYLTDPDGRLMVFSPGDRTLSPFESGKLGLGGTRGNARGTLVSTDTRCSQETVAARADGFLLTDVTLKN